MSSPRPGSQCLPLQARQFPQPSPQLCGLPPSQSESRGSPAPQTPYLGLSASFPAHVPGWGGCSAPSRGRPQAVLLLPSLPLVWVLGAFPGLPGTCLIHLASAGLRGMDWAHSTGPESVGVGRGPRSALSWGMAACDPPPHPGHIPVTHCCHFLSPAPAGMASCLTGLNGFSWN